MPSARSSTVAGGVAVQLLFFGKVGDRFGRTRRLGIPPGGCSVGWIKAQLSQQVDDGGAALSEAGVRFAVDRQMVLGDEAWVTPGQEVAFFSAFSGG
jgi:hypothetical protein